MPFCVAACKRLDGVLLQSMKHGHAAACVNSLLQLTKHRHATAQMPGHTDMQEAPLWSDCLCDSSMWHPVTGKVLVVTQAKRAP
jgi:hypothetical protein